VLRLQPEQLELLEQLTLRRMAAGTGEVLAQAWPAMPERLKERWPAFVEAALLQGRRQGLVDLPELACYASLWCVWGPAFEDKPGFDWAQDILTDARRSPSLKMHQLVHRSREELRLRPPPPPGSPPALSVAAFDAALAGVARKVGALSMGRAVFPPAQLKPVVRACDLSTIDMMLAEVEGLQEYQPLAGGWQRVPVPRLAVPVQHWTRAPDEPVRLAVPSHALRSGPLARLNLKLQTLAVCDPRVHPEVVHSGGPGRLAWKGRDTARLSLALYALPPPAAKPEVSPPGIGAESPADAQKVVIGSCGLRDAGAPFGEVLIQLSVVAATQTLCEVRQPAWPALSWPVTAIAPAAATPPVCRVEADGVVQPPGRWQADWTGFHAVYQQGLERLFNAWSRAVDAQAPHLEVEGSALMGQAGLTWGWRRTDPATVALRVEGALDMLACAIDLHLSGDVVLAGARARLRLHCQGRQELRMAISQLGAEAAPGQNLKAAQRSWRFPFRVEVETLAGAELATLSAAPMPDNLLGAIAGECGLRPRADGAGSQWFFELRLEPVTLVFQCHDPVLGDSTHTLPMLEAMTLVEWSGG